MPHNKGQVSSRDRARAGIHAPEASVPSCMWLGVFLRNAASTAGATAGDIYIASTSENGASELRSSCRTDEPYPGDGTYMTKSTSVSNFPAQKGSLGKVDRIPSRKHKILRGLECISRLRNTKRLLQAAPMRTHCPHSSRVGVRVASADR